MQSRASRARRIAAYLDSPEPHERAVAQRLLAELGYIPPLPERSVPIEELPDLVSVIVQAAGGSVHNDQLRAHPIALPRLVEFVGQVHAFYLNQIRLYERAKSLFSEVGIPHDISSFTAGLVVGLIDQACKPIPENSTCQAMVLWWGDDASSIDDIPAQPIVSPACFRAGMNAAARFSTASQP